MTSQSLAQVLVTSSTTTEFKMFIGTTDLGWLSCFWVNHNLSKSGADLLSALQKVGSEFIYYSAAK